MIGRQSRATLAILASATVLNATGAAAATTGDLFFVNATKRAVSLTLDDQPRAAPFMGEVLGRRTVSGPHTLHIAVEGGPGADVPLTFDPDHVAQDQNGRSFWCVVAAIDNQQQLRTVAGAPSDCSKLVAAGLHPPPAGEAPAGLKGDLYFLNVSGGPLALAIDRGPPGPVADHQGFGTSITPGPHDLHLTVGDARSVDIHLNFNGANLGRDRRGAGYWCVGVGADKAGAPVVIQVEAAKCGELVGQSGRPTP